MLLTGPEHTSALSIAAKFILVLLLFYPWYNFILPYIITESKQPDNYI
jgi:hypothetical protein